MADFLVDLIVIGGLTNLLLLW